MPNVDVIQPIADNLADKCRTIGLNVPGKTWTLGSVNPPAAEIELPDLARTAPEEAESQLGSDDWDLEFPVTIWVDLTRPTEAQVRLKDYLEAWIAAVDADRQLADLDVQIVDASVVSAERVYAVGEGRSRGLVGYETVVMVHALVLST